MWDWFKDLFSSQSPSSSYGGGGGGGSWWSDPRFWMGVGGTGLGAYSLYNNNRQQQNWQKQQQDIFNYNRQQSEAAQQAWANAQAMEAARWGEYAGAYGDAASSFMGQRNQLANQILQQAKSPLDWRQYYEPITESARKALTRSSMATSQTRGLADSAYADALAGEVVAKDDTQRIIEAMSLAQTGKASEAQALASILGSMGFIAPPAPGPMMSPLTPGQVQMPYLPAFPGGGGGGGLDSLGQYFNLRSAETARRRAAAEQERMWRELMASFSMMQNPWRGASSLPSPYDWTYSSGYWV